jgi:hypothetical protein
VLRWNCSGGEGRQIGLDLTEADLLLPGSLVALSLVLYGVAVAVWSPPAVCADRAFARLSALLCGSLDCAPVEAVWLCVTAPVEPVCDGLNVCGWLFDPEFEAVVLGVEAALPLFMAAPPVAVVLPAVWVNPTLRLFWDVPPTTCALLEFLPESPAPPVRT